jgi:hypothetical protein
VRYIDKLGLAVGYGPHGTPQLVVAQRGEPSRATDAHTVESRLDRAEVEELREVCDRFLAGEVIR